MTQRLFIGVELEERVREALEEALVPARRAAGDHVRWLPAAQWHITLQFLGAVEPATVPALRAACQDAVQGLPCFALHFTTLGAFASPRRARVLWMGVEQGAAELGQLAQRVRQRTAALGLPPEARPFVPHLTVGRLREPRDLRTMLQLPLPVIEGVAGGLTLFCSHLSPRGSRYEALLRCPLSDL